MSDYYVRNTPHNPYQNYQYKPVYTYSKTGAVSYNPFIIENRKKPESKQNLTTSAKVFLYSGVFLVSALLAEFLLCKGRNLKNLINKLFNDTVKKEPIKQKIQKPKKPKQPKAEQPKVKVVEPPKVEPPKAELPKAEVVEPPKVEPPKVESPKVEKPKAEKPKAEVVEPPKVEPPKVEPPKVEKPKAEKPKAEVIEPPKVEPPKAEPPKVEPPKVEKPEIKIPENVKKEAKPLQDEIKTMQEQLADKKQRLEILNNEYEAAPITQKVQITGQIGDLEMEAMRLEFALKDKERELEKIINGASIL